ncbi:MAG: chemotaxis protein CheB [Planctomycetota bacterium]
MVDSSLDDPATDFPVVGIGASAGGLEAIEQLFDHIPAGTGAAFVVVQHLSPDFKSLMDQLLARHTDLAIQRAEDGMRVEPESIYLIPPRRDLQIRDRRLWLSDQRTDRQVPLPIDVFFHSLARDVGERAVGIILSGTGSDGSRGVVAIKDAGGLVMVQDRASAKFDGMPMAATASGAADMVLAPPGLAERLQICLAAPSLTHSSALPALEEQEPMRDIIEVLRRNKGVDFSLYKPRTITRRLRRRMGVLQVNDLARYRSLLTSSQEEIDQLYQDFLISVTEFCRDPEGFHAVESQLGALVELAGDNELRVWVAACATGEEAYSLAILLDEYQATHGKPNSYKIFATDVDTRAIDRASEALYPFGIGTHLSEHRVNRYLERQEDGYRVRRAIRDRVVFAHHDVTKDPPFTRMHLVSCRNLLIYLTAETQSRVLRLLHFALVPRGKLFLGPSEVLADLQNEFAEVDRKWKLFEKLRDVHLGAVQHIDPARRPGHETPPTRRARAQADLERICGALTEELVSACLIVNEQFELQRVIGQGHPYISVPTGQASADVMKMLAPAARTAIATAMERARTIGEPIACHNVQFSAEPPTVADVRIRFVPPTRGSGQQPIFLIMIGHTLDGMTDRAELQPTSSQVSDRIMGLEAELQFSKESLQSTIEELETTNEELQSTNEELLASNEELQSTNEELHSVNEELYTVNAEHQRKIEELTELAGDMENLMRGTEVGVLFLDDDLRVRKYTPHVQDVVALLPSDLGRPVDHFAHELHGVDLPQVARQVLNSGERVELEAEDKRGVPRLLRILPYRLADRRVGVLVTLIDLTEVRQAERSAARSERRFRDLVENLDQVFWSKAPGDLQFHYVSPLFTDLWGLTAEDLYGDGSMWLSPIEPADRERVKLALQHDCAKNEEFRLTDPEGRERWIRMRGFPIAEHQQIKSVSGFAQDITKEKQQETRLRLLADELENQAQTDALTGLMNRRGLEIATAREQARASRTGEPLTAVLIDLDNFKAFNDRLGHAVGDTVLQGVAQRMQRVLRPSDLLSRVGGDEFLALLPETRLAEAVSVAERLRLAIADHAMEVSGQPLAITASLGVAAIPAGMMSIEELLICTRESLATSKKQGKNRVVAATDAGGRRTTSVVGEQPIEDFLRADSLRVVAQTIRQVSSQEVIGYEMLSRGPAGPYSGPADFFRLSHERSQLTQIDLRCLRNCVANAEALAPYQIHVNIFPSTLMDTPIDRIVELFGDTDRSRFCVELSEQQFLGTPAYLVEAVKKLRDAGVRLGIDDVGYGRSSVEALVVLEPEVVKIAREFVSEADRNPAKRRGLERLVRSTRTLATELIAEGVERAEERELLIELGIDRAQGFLWDKPRPVSACSVN